MVKPAGTGSPILVISARPAPFPPNKSRHSPLPSALPAPKKYTHFFTVTLDVGFNKVHSKFSSKIVSHRSHPFEFCRSFESSAPVRTYLTGPQPLLSLSA